MPYSITSTNWHTDKFSLIYIREQVFMQEQNVSADDEWDGKDETAMHLLVRSSDGNAIGCARILTETHMHKTCFHIGRVALLKDWRDRGIGNQLMQTAITWCQQLDSTRPIFIHAQTQRLDFYRRLGFKIHGDIFMDAGIPHIEMWYKTLE